MSWDTTDICTPSDLEQELGDLTLLTQVSDSESDVEVLAGIKSAKKLITDKLRAYLPELFVTTTGQYSNITWTNWLIAKGYSYSDLDTVLESITNVSVINSAAVALSIVCICNRGLTKFTGTYNERANVLADQRDFWQKKFNERWCDGYKQLTLDLSGDGIIQDFERVKTHNTFLRS